MNVFYKSGTGEIEKKLFNLKPIRKDGLVLQIHHTITDKGVEKRVRFLYSAFDSSGLILANADIEGNVFVVDFSCDKFWSLPKLSSCTVLAFSPLQINDLFIGCKTGDLFIIDVQLGTIIGYLQGHKNPVKSVSFADDLCLTASLTQAIIYNFKTFCKVHELTIESPTTLKQIFFMPVTNDIIACFSDDYIHVWKNRTFESFKKLLPTDWNKFFLKSIAVTRNGSTMVLAGIASKLIIFSLDTWSVTKILSLSEEVTIKSADFISQAHDGGANKFLILLTGSGAIHFLNMEQYYVVTKIQLESEIISFTSSVNGMHLACVLKSGEVNIYKLSLFIETLTLDMCDPNCDMTRKKTKLYLPHVKQPKEELNITKLQGILKQYGEYPESYRALIWSKILILPNNVNSFKSITNKGYNKTIASIAQKYPLVNKSALKNLKLQLSNLANWSLVFCHIEFLPLFVFPFIKIFENDPLICFEAIITIILNWCQHWFQYAPCVPINILAMIENMLVEHDAELLAFLTEKGVTSHIYAWPILETAFSEILTIKEWCKLWDHILSNEPALMLMVPVAYNILCRLSLGTLTTLEDFELFYRKQNPVGIQKLISKSYYLLNNTSETNHPRKYLNSFEKLPEGSYPVFDDYSKILVNLESSETEKLTKPTSTEEEISSVETKIKILKGAECERQTVEKRNQEEAKRLQQLEDMYQEKKMEERERMDKRKIELSKLKTELMEMQAESIEISRIKIEEANLKDRKRELDKMLKNIEYSQMQDDLDIQQTEEDISKHYVELLKQKTILENMLLHSLNDVSLIPEKYKTIEKQRKIIKDELEKIRKSVYFNRLKNKVNIPIGITVANDRTQNIDMVLAKEIAARKMHVSQSRKNRQIIKMENDTKDLEDDVQNLLNKFTNSKLNEADNLLGHLTTCLSDRKKLLSKDINLLK